MLKQIIEIILKYRGFFSLDQVVTDSGWDRAEVKHRLDRLESEGLIKRQKERPGQNHKRPGGPAPKEILYIKKKGLRERLDRMIRQKADTSRDKIWRALRVMRHVTTADIIQLCDAKEDNVRHYLEILEREGFVRRAGRLYRPKQELDHSAPGREPLEKLDDVERLERADKKANPIGRLCRPQEELGETNRISRLRRPQEELGETERIGRLCRPQEEPGRAGRITWILCKDPGPSRPRVKDKLNELD